MAITNSASKSWASRDHGLLVGDKIGCWIVKEVSAEHLKLGGSTLAVITTVVGGIVALTIWAIRLQPVLQQGHFGQALLDGGRVNTILLGVTFGCLIGPLRETLTFRFDGNAKRIYKSRLLIPYARLQTSDFKGVVLSVVHFQSLEQLELSLIAHDRKNDIFVARILTHENLIKLIAAAEHLSLILGLPLVRAGKIIQGKESQPAFEATPAVTVGGDGQDVLFNCPRCHVRAGKAVIFDRTQSSDLDGLAEPLFKDRTTFILCLSCNKKTYSPAPLSMLRGKSPEELDLLLRSYLSRSSRVLAVVAIALSWFPVFGPMIALLAVASNAKHLTRWLVLSIVALAGSSTWNGYLYVSEFGEPAVQPPSTFRSPSLRPQPASEDVK